MTGCHYGMGKHLLALQLPDAQRAGEAAYIFEAIFPFCTTTTKISILLLYRRIFTTHTPWFKWTLYAIMAFSISWTLAGFFTLIFQCTPVRHYWEKIVPHAYCLNWASALIALAAINAVWNASILLLPLPMIWKLQMPFRRRIAVSAIFVIGSGYVRSPKVAYRYR